MEMIQGRKIRIKSHINIQGPIAYKNLGKRVAFTQQDCIYSTVNRALKLG